MRLNPDCMRIILKFCVEHIDYKEIGTNSWFEKTVSLDMLYKCNELSNFEKKEIMYSVMKLYEYRYIKLSDIYPNDKTYYDRCTISDITIYGHDFYNSIQEDTVWNKTKNIIGKAGNHTLKFIEDTAQLVAMESAKQAVTIMMTAQN